MYKKDTLYYISYLFIGIGFLGISFYILPIHFLFPFVSIIFFVIFIVSLMFLWRLDNIWSQAIVIVFILLFSLSIFSFGSLGALLWFGLLSDFINEICKFVISIPENILIIFSISSVSLGVILKFYGDKKMKYKWWWE